MALEYSRFINKFFSVSCKFRLCSLLECNVNDLVLPKLNLHMKHISIGFCNLLLDDVVVAVDEPVPAFVPIADVVVPVTPAIPDNDKSVVDAFVVRFSPVVDVIAPDVSDVPDKPDAVVNNNDDVDDDEDDVVVLFIFASRADITRNECILGLFVVCVKPLK